MAFIRLAFFAGASREHFERVAAALGAAPPPPGRLLFVAGQVEGGYQVVQVWRSREELDRFNREVYLPALATVGPGPFPSPTVVTDMESEVFLRG